MPHKSKVEKKRTKKANLELAFEVGHARAFEEASSNKTAGLESRVGGLLARTAPLWAPAAAGGVVAGPEHRTEGALAGLGLGILGKRVGRKLLRRGLFKPPELELAGRAAKLGPESSELKNLVKSLGERGEEFGKGVQTLRSQGPVAEWGGRLAGGVGGGYLANQLLSQRPMSPFQSAPAVSDISSHYTGLIPGEEYY